MIIDFGTSTIAGITDYITDLFSDLLPLTLLLIGIFLAFWIIEALVGLMKKEK